MAPLPPSAKFVHTAARTPIEAAISRIASCSEGKSPGKALIATTGLTPKTWMLLDLLAQVGASDEHLFGVLLEDGRGEGTAGCHLVTAGVDLQRPHRGDDHRRRRA